MQPIIYAMQFSGQSTPVGNPPTGLSVVGTAPSVRFYASVDDRGLAASIQPQEGDTSQFESSVTFAADGGFTEEGTITFGGGSHRVRFTTVGEGAIGPSADGSGQAGAVIWKVTGGDGQFAGASGYVVSNFLVTPTGGVTDNHLGVIFPADTH